MTPFQQFRYWLRRSPRAERLTSLVAGLVGLAVLLALAVPTAGGGGADELAFEEVTGPEGAATSAPGIDGPAGSPEDAGSGVAEAPGDAAGGSGAPSGSSGLGGPAGSGTPPGSAGGSAPRPAVLAALLPQAPSPAGLRVPLTRG